MAGTAGGPDRRAAKLVGVAFFAGIVLNLTILGALAGRLGGVLTEAFGRYWALGMIAMSVAAGAAALVLPLDSDWFTPWRRTGLAATMVYGFLFSLGTSAAPLLLVLTVAAAHGRPEYGFLLALAFGIGRGLPFLIAGWFAGVLMRFAWLNRHARAVQIASGIALLGVGAYYASAFAALS
jgi:cytochrome c-type biogenesis protein